jgi:hypothetical protein
VSARAAAMPAAMPPRRVQQPLRGCASLALALAVALGVAVHGAAGAKVSGVTVSEGSGGALLVSATVDGDGGAAAAGATLRYTLGFSKEERSVNMTHAGCVAPMAHARLG